MNCRKLPDDPTKQRINSPRNGHVIVLTYFKNKKQHAFGSTTTASWLKHNLHLVTFFNVTGRWDDFLPRSEFKSASKKSHDFQGRISWFFSTDFQALMKDFPQVFSSLIWFLLGQRKHVMPQKCPTLSRSASVRSDWPGTEAVKICAENRTSEVGGTRWAATRYKSNYI